MDFEKAKKVVKDFSNEVMNFNKENALSDLKDFKRLQNKDSIGNDYRHDQWYFENISNFKAKYFSLKSYFLSRLSETVDRILTRKLENMITYIEEQIKFLDVLAGIAKQRIKFYESIIYLVSNFNYGNY